MKLQEWLEIHTDGDPNELYNLDQIDDIEVFLNDNTKIMVNKHDVEKIVHVYEELNDKNQKIFEEMICDNFDTFVCMLGFCREYQ
jgi:hypothetical protein